MTSWWAPLARRSSALFDVAHETEDLIGPPSFAGPANTDGNCARRLSKRGAKASPQNNIGGSCIWVRFPIRKSYSVAVPKLSHLALLHAVHEAFVFGHPRQESTALAKRARCLVSASITVKVAIVVRGRNMIPTVLVLVVDADVVGYVPQRTTSRGLQLPKVSSHRRERLRSRLGIIEPFPESGPDSRYAAVIY